MRTLNTSAPRPYGTLAHAQEQLIRDVGGFAVAAKLAKRSISTLHDYTNHDKPGTNMPLHIAMKLEGKVESFPVTAHLASLSNLFLVRLAPSNVRNYWLNHVSRITKEFSDILQASHECLADDGKLDMSEARRLLKEIDEHLQVLADMRVAVATHIEELGQEMTAALRRDAGTKLT